MPAATRAPALLMIAVVGVFFTGIAFGAVAALTQKRPAMAKATEPAPDTTPDPAPQEPAKPEPKKDPPKKTEPKVEPKKDLPKVEPKKPDPKPEPKKPDPPKAEPVSISYEKQILPIFKMKCFLCHGDPKRDGGLDLKTVKSILEGGDSGPAVVPGKPKDSPVWVRIDDGSMPKNPKDRLSAAEKKLITDWINAGAK